MGSFAPLEKSAQQLREEEAEKRAIQEPVFKGKGTSSWLGGKKADPQPEMKVSGWARKAMEEGNQAPVKFAPLKTA